MGTIETTTGRGYRLPVETNTVLEDVENLRLATQAINADVVALLLAVGGKASTLHVHLIGDIDGLAGALAGKAAVNHNHTIGGLTNVDSAADTAAPGSIFYLGPSGVWVVGNPATVLGSHQHAIENIEGLSVALDGKLTTASLPAAFAAPVLKATPVDADSIPLIDSADANKQKRLSWTAIKATLKAYFDTLYSIAGHAHGVATSSVAGFMSAADKGKLDGIAAGADQTPGAATTTADGLLSAADKVKLNGIAAGAQANPGAATSTAAGLMSAADKIKLNGVEQRSNHTGTQDAGTLTGTLDPARLPQMSAGTVVLCVPNGNGSFDTGVTLSSKQVAVDFVALASGTVTMSAGHRQDAADGSAALRFLEFRKNGSSIGSWTHTATTATRTVNVAVTPGDILTMVLSAASPGSPHQRTAYLTNGRIMASSKDTGLVIPLAPAPPY